MLKIKNINNKIIVCGNSVSNLQAYLTYPINSSFVGIYFSNNITPQNDIKQYVDNRIFIPLIHFQAKMSEKYDKCSWTQVWNQRKEWMKIIKIYY